ncbi:hypothetical protein ACP70R_031514 [Stipagrostis hirtigluma subsp. patula]
MPAPRQRPRRVDIPADRTHTRRGASFSALIPYIRRRWWVGAKDDWLATIDKRGGVQLVNPYTGYVIDLPHSTAVTGHIMFRRILVCCETPSGAGDDEGYLIIAVVSLNRTGLAIATGGDDRWTASPDSPGHHFGYISGVVMNKGKLFAVDGCGKMYSWDICGGACPEPEEVRPAHVERDGDLKYRWRLAESADGCRLLLVCIYGKQLEVLRDGRYYDVKFYTDGVRLYHTSGIQTVTTGGGL